MWKACGFGIWPLRRTSAKSIRRQCSTNSPSDTDCIQFVVYLLACLVSYTHAHTQVHTCTERERELVEGRVGLLSCSWPGFMPDHWHSYLHICWAAAAAALARLLYLNVLNFQITFYQQNYRMVSSQKERQRQRQGNARAKARQSKAKSWPRMTTAAVLAVSLLHCNLNLCSNFQL